MSEPQDLAPVPEPRHGRRTWPQRLLLATGCVVIVGLLATAGALGYVYSKYSQLPRVALGGVLSERSSNDTPQNFLIVGVDSAEGLDDDDAAVAGRGGVTGLRSDVVMVLRVEPGAGSASLLSIPRDLWVPLASGGSRRINAAIQIGGPTELIETIESYLAIPINHYVQVDFAGFQGLVDAVGGVPVAFPHPVRDRESGLVVPDAGCVTLDPEQALAFVRSRHYQTFEDGRWRTDITGDLGRIERQQDFIRRALRRAVDRGARNPVTMDNLIDVGLRSVVVDDILTAEDILDLGRRFRSFNPDTLELLSLPVVDDTIGGAAVLRLIDREAQPLLDRFRGRAGDELDPSSVRVKVLNGSGISGEARGAVEELERVGFGITGWGEADAFGQPRTIVRHAPGHRDAADLVARWLQGGAVIEEVDVDIDADAILITGNDYAGLRDAPAPTTSTSAPGPTATTQPDRETTTTTEVDEPGGISC